MLKLWIEYEAPLDTNITNALVTHLIIICFNTNGGYKLEKNFQMCYQFQLSLPNFLGTDFYVIIVLIE